jgi:predicted extracellular nuclease
MQFKKPNLLFLLVVLSALVPLDFGQARPRRGSRAETALCAELLKKDKRRKSVKTPVSRGNWHQDYNRNKWSPQPWGERKSVRFMTLNLYNIYTHLGREASRTDGFNKTEVPMRDTGYDKVKQKAASILDIMPDVAVLQEIEHRKGRDGSAEATLNRFVDEELYGLYSGIATNNTNDHIEIGFIIKKELFNDYEFKIISHADRHGSRVNPETGIPERIFTRDFPVLLMRKKGDQIPFMAFFGVHLKSKSVMLSAYERKNGGKQVHWQSAENRMRRKYIAEIREIIKVVKSFRKQYPTTRFMVSGDFNRDILASPHVQRLSRELGLTDALTSFSPSLDAESGATAFYFENNSKRHFRRLDGNFLSHQLQRHIKDAWIYRYRDERGYELPLPKTYDEREAILPSDHYPVVVDIDTAAW